MAFVDRHMNQIIIFCLVKELVIQTEDPLINDRFRV